MIDYTATKSFQLVSNMGLVITQPSLLVTGAGSMRTRRGFGVDSARFRRGFDTDLTNPTRSRLGFDTDSRMRRQGRIAQGGAIH
eukprot:4902159-Pyramimonas_sp.AAC.1